MVSKVTVMADNLEVEESIPLEPRGEQKKRGKKNPRHAWGQTITAVVCSGAKTNYATRRK
jgi:hypothetical protein